MSLVCIAAGSLAVGAQPVVRTRDVGFAAVRYDNGGAFGALTLNETAALERSSGSLFANGLLSLFNDGRWSMQGSLSGSRMSAPLQPRGFLGRHFSSVQGEMLLTSVVTAQQGLMPTVQVNAQARMHMSHERYGTYGGALLARTFDGFGWRTTVAGDFGGWWQSGTTAVLYVAARPMQLQTGDLLGDNEAGVSWVRGRSRYDVNAGVRLGEAQSGNAAWGSVTATWPLRPGIFGALSAGSYPVDLIQGLPGGTYMSFALRLPNGRWPEWRRRDVPRVPLRVVVDELPTREPLALVMGPALDSLFIREIRVWAPGIQRVELMADFVDWVAVPLVRHGPGEWRGYYRVPPGTHRLNLRLDGVQIETPRNLVTVDDEFTGKVALIVVP